MTSTVTLGGTPVDVAGDFPMVGDSARAFSLVDQGLADITLASFGSKRKVLNIFPSLDTDVCAASVRRFNQAANDLSDTVVLCISADLPFAQARFCGAEGLKNVITLSTMRGQAFLEDYGVSITSGPLVGLAARAVVVLDCDNKVIYAQLVPKIEDEPDYEAALSIVKA